MTSIGKIGVCGAGAMGSGIAQVAAQAGHAVIVYDVAAGSRERSEAMIAKGLAQLVSRGKLDQAAAAAVATNLSWTDDIAALARCDLVIEAIVEDFAVKQALFAQLEDVLRPDAVIATNTSSLPIARLGRALKAPDRFVGMHFFNPATVMKLVEVVSGPATDPAIAGRIEALARAWGKVAVAVADVPGFIVNRVARPFYAEAFRCVQQNGAAAAVIDHLFRAAAGFRMGPLELTDMIGQDINFAVARSVHDSCFGQTRFAPQLVQSALVDANWLGRKTGRGVYDYADGKGPDKPEPLTAPALPDAPSRPLPFADGFVFSGCRVMASRGLTARAESLACGERVILLDWFDGERATAAGFAVSDESCVGTAVALLSGWGLQAFRLADRPGLVVLRTLAQIANAAGDAVHEGVSSAQGIDDALRFGANYPFGPMAWADAAGASRLVAILAGVASGTGQPMYNPSEYWLGKS